MSKGFIWICQNNKNTDYVELSVALAKSIKRYNKENKICVITDNKTKINAKEIDIVLTMKEDASEDHDIKWANEYKVFMFSPFKHSIKLAADMLWTTNTDWWWHHLWQHDLVFSVNCRNYKDMVVKNTPYRNLFIRNNLPNIYNGLMYFRKSKWAQLFFDTAKHITDNWKKVKNNILINCHDEYPSTDVVYALAYRMIDPTNKKLIDYEWFKFLHHKPFVDGLINKDQNTYLYHNKNRNY